MRLSPVFLAAAAGAATFAIGQAVVPTVHAQGGNPVPALQVRVQSLHAKHTLSGLELTGRIKNTGRQALTYTSVVCVCTDATGTEIGRGDGYLLAGPVEPGQSAGFRAALLQMPAFTHLSLRLRESGQTVIVQPAQAPDSQRTTVR